MTIDNVPVTVDRTDREEPAQTTGAGFPPMQPLSWSQPEEAPAVDRSRWSRRTHYVLFALSGLCVALASLVFFAGDTYFVVDRILPPALWFMAICTLLNMATSFDERRGQPSWGLRTLVGVVLLWVAFGVHTVWSANTEDLSSVRSPDGRFTAVVTEGTSTIEPTWDVTVHQNAGLLSRRWDAGCISRDDPAIANDSLVWVDDTTFEVRTDSGQQLRATLDNTGRPLSRVTNDDASCP